MIVSMRVRTAVITTITNIFHNTYNTYNILYIIHLFIVYFNEPYVVYVNAIVSIFLWS